MGWVLAGCSRCVPAMLHIVSVPRERSCCRPHHPAAAMREEERQGSPGDPGSGPCTGLGTLGQPQARTPQGHPPQPQAPYIIEKGMEKLGPEREEPHGKVTRTHPIHPSR